MAKGLMAFPRPSGPIPGVQDEMQDGMELRDYFAARAMEALLVSSPSSADVSSIVGASYNVADAMLEARSRR